MLPAAVLFRLEPVEEDKVQAAVMPPAPGLVFVMMGSVNTSEGFHRFFHGDARLVVPLMRFPFPSSTNLCPRCIVRRLPPCETLGPRRCWFFDFLRVEQTGCR